MSLSKLLESGAKVHVQHYRYYNRRNHRGKRGSKILKNKHEANVSGLTNQDLVQKGGMTVLATVLKNGKMRIEVVRCHENDNFNRRRALTIAADRVIKSETHKSLEE